MYCYVVRISWFKCWTEGSDRVEELPERFAQSMKSTNIFVRSKFDQIDITRYRFSFFVFIYVGATELPARKPSKPSNRQRQLRQIMRHFTTPVCT